MAEFAQIGPLLKDDAMPAYQNTPTHNGAVVSTQNPLPGLGMDPIFAASYNGAISGKSASVITVLGSRSNGWTSTSVFGDACDYLDTSQAAMNTPTTGQTLYIVSTSTSDSAAGTGARTVSISYLDTSGNRQVHIATMNGTTPVSIGTGYSFVQWAEVATVGSGGFAAGNISITSTNGSATVATTFEYISSGGNRSLSGRYKVPSGFSAYAISWSASAIGNTMDCRLRADVFSSDRSLSPGVFHFMDRAYLTSGRDGIWLQYMDKYPAGAVIKVSAIPGGAPAGNKLDCDFSLLVVED